MRRRTFEPAIFILLITWIALGSCRKERSPLEDSTHFKTISSDTQYQTVGIIPLSDGNFISLSNDYFSFGTNRFQGNLVKLDSRGNILWKKLLPSSITVVFRLLPLPGDQFLVFGWKTSYDYHSTACIFNNDGELTGSYRVNNHNWNGYFPPFDILRLSNGHFVVSGAEEMESGIGVFKVLDPSFALESSEIFFNREGNYFNSFNAMCELPDGNIALLAKTSKEQYEPQYNLIYYKLSQKGDLLTYRLLKDTGYYETANGILPYGSGTVAVTAGINAGAEDGVAVNYTNNFNNLGRKICGRIRLLVFDSIGRIQRKIPVEGYPGLGMINSMRKTDDGGFILCGTVGQSNSTILVSFTRIFLVKLDAGLNVEWQKIIETEYPAYGTEAIPNGKGGFLVCGSLRSFNKKYEMIVFRTDGSGNM